MRARELVREGDTVFIDSGSTCFLGTTSFSDKGFFASQNTIEAKFKKTVLESSRRRIVLSDSSKCNKSAFSIFAKPENVDILVTDTGFKHKLEFQAWGIEVILA